MMFRYFVDALHRGVGLCIGTIDMGIALDLLNPRFHAFHVQSDCDC